VKRWLPWLFLALLSVFAGSVAWHYFPEAFSIVSLDITMDRDAALREARTIVAREQLGPPDFRQASSFALDDEVQTFVELEGGGKDAFTAMLRDGLYSAYAWRVRQFREGDPNETTVRFTPDGRPYGFVEKLKEDAPGAALTTGEARQRAEADAQAKWHVDLSPYALVEQGQERRPGGRVDHTFTYERAAPTLKEGRYRLRLVESGDRLTEVTHFVRIPEAFTRRYQNLRSANEAIGVGSVVGMVLLYVVGGIGIGLFYMMRGRWLLWRRAAIWGTAVGLAQALATANQWPLMWMTYDTALPRATFITQQAALLVAMFLGFSVFFALSFMAAETLSRRAFPSHPQFWKVWEKEPGSSTAILGRTAAGYLLVTIFFAYDVLLYLYATRMLGWWAPAEALVQPDVLATYMPWLSAIANSFQAGFWEECLFRAVPIAGAALIGERFGQRRLFIVIAFVVQAVVFGAGHAPYPTQPSYARPVELIIPSIGFGLLYLYFGLLPGIVLHFTFDVVWFALPIFIAQAPGIWIQKVMVVVVTLVPLWVVLWRRVQVGRWTALSPADRNAAWTPPPPAAPAPAPVTAPHFTLSPRLRTAWLVLGAVALLACAAALFARERAGSLPVSRAEAEAIARRALAERGVTLTPSWRVLPAPDSGEGEAHEFVAETSGDERRKALLGSYLSSPRWVVRVATFEGDVAERAEEWQVSIAGNGEVRRVAHILPQDRAGAALEEPEARALAQQALRDRYALDVGKGQAREVSARPEKLKARTDWEFAFVDTTVPPLSSGEPRISVQLAGREIAATGRFVYIPEDWQRGMSAARTRNLVLQILSGIVFGGLLAGAAVTGVIAWSRRQYSPRLFFIAMAVMFVASAINTANGWPTVLASLQTALPLQLQIIGVAGIGLVALTINSALVALAIGGVPGRLASAGEIGRNDAWRMGVALGLFGAAVALAAGAVRSPAWANAPYVAPLGTIVPWLDLAVDPILAFMTRIAVIMSLFALVYSGTAGGTRRTIPWTLLIVAVGFFAGGPPVGQQLGAWVLAGLLTAAALWAGYATLIRADISVVPMAIGTMVAISVLARGFARPFPGAMAGSIVAAAVTFAVAWWWFSLVRKARAAAAAPVSAAAARG
jgi:hypothetical protein